MLELNIYSNYTETMQLSYSELFIKNLFTLRTDNAGHLAKYPTGAFGL
jgi:hypothetical protein